MSTMTVSFQSQHASMLLKYAGISFISGAVNHGFFSGERSLWTAAIGIVLFVFGAWWEHHLTSSTAETPKTLLQTLLWGTLLSIGLGFFTGGLQHFPDSPARSAWVVPTGFFVSVIALAVNGDFRWSRATWMYVAIVGALTGAGSYAAWQWLEANPQAPHSHETHSHDSVAMPTPSASSTPLVAQTITRSVTLHMDDKMRFTPNAVPVQAGETIRFIVHNDGAVAHEFVVGNHAEIQAHAAVMRDMAAGAVHNHAHGAGAALRVEAGKMGEIVVTFPRAESLEMACLIPGHFEAGMFGKIDVSSEKHDHSSHQHQH